MVQPTVVALGGGEGVDPGRPLKGRQTLPRATGSSTRW